MTVIGRLLRKGPRRALRVFFATDIHGSDRCFRKFLAAAEIYQADALVLGGDVAGKGLVPIQSQNGSLTAKVHGQAVTVPRSDEDRLRADLNRLGFYSVVVDGPDLERLETDSAFVDRTFRNEIVAQITEWCALADQRLAPNVRCLITPGNDDPTFIDPVLKAGARVESPERELCQVGPVLVASMGDVTPTPWNTEREYSEEDLGKRIDKIMRDAPGDVPVVWNFHCPPYGSGLDLAPEIDGTLRPVLRGGRPSVVPVGSKAVREGIMKYQPVVALHGHIHEARGVQRLGKTICINPGSDYGSDVLKGAIVDFGDDGRFLDFLLTSG